MWHALEVVWNTFELLFHWRVNICIVLAIAIVLLLTWAHPALPRTTLIGAAILIGGGLGLVWEFTSTWSSSS